MKPQIIRKDGKPEYAVVPYDEYQKLLADAELLADLSSYDAAQRALTSGDEELIPAMVIDRLLDGDNPLRVWREYRGLSCTQLAASCAVSTAAVSQLESDKRQPSVALLKKLAAALRVDLEQLTNERPSPGTTAVHEAPEMYEKPR